MSQWDKSLRLYKGDCDEQAQGSMREVKGKLELSQDVNEDKTGVYRSCSVNHL